MVCAFEERGESPIAIASSVTGKRIRTLRILMGRPLSFVASNDDSEYRTLLAMLLQTIC